MELQNFIELQLLFLGIINEMLKVYLVNCVGLHCTSDLNISVKYSRCQLGGGGTHL